jgi:endonuclease/exonuclease/phosphatase family metal-dependent hydrolase
MGDLNGSEDSRELIALVGANDVQGRKLFDSYRELHSKRTADEASFNDWAGTRTGSRIDFILHTDDFKPIAADIVRSSYDGRWPSDHYPVTATLRLNSEE